MYRCVRFPRLWVGSRSQGSLQGLRRGKQLPELVQKQRGAHQSMGVVPPLALADLVRTPHHGRRLQHASHAGYCSSPPLGQVLLTKLCPQEALLDFVHGQGQNLGHMVA